jgi:hypothetical protein
MAGTMKHTTLVVTRVGKIREKDLHEFRSHRAARLISLKIGVLSGSM